MAEKNKLPIICMSGDFDKAIAAFTLASGPAAVNHQYRSKR
jgi:peroxiredoxin family protein